MAWATAFQQAEVVVQPVGAAQLELHPRRRQLRPPAVETIQHRIHRGQSQGDAGGHPLGWIQAPEPPQRMAEPLPIPVPQGQVNGTTGRRTQGRQQGLEPLRTVGSRRIQLRQQRQQLLFHSLESKGTVTGLESTGLAAADQPIPVQA